MCRTKKKCQQSQAAREAAFRRCYLSGFKYVKDSLASTVEGGGGKLGADSSEYSLSLAHLPWEQ